MNTDIRHPTTVEIEDICAKCLLIKIADSARRHSLLPCFTVRGEGDEHETGEWRFGVGKGAVGACAILQLLKLAAGWSARERLPGLMNDIFAGILNYKHRWKSVSLGH